jgi:hypothetical protein
VQPPTASASVVAAVAPWQPRSLRRALSAASLAARASAVGDAAAALLPELLPLLPPDEQALELAWLCPGPTSRHMIGRCSHRYM